MVSWNFVSQIPVANAHHAAIMKIAYPVQSSFVEQELVHNTFNTATFVSTNVQLCLLMLYT